MKRLATVGAVCVVACALLLLVFLRAPHRPALVWLTHAEVARIMNPPAAPTSRLPPMLLWGWHWVRSLAGLEGRRRWPEVEISIEAFKVSAIGGEVALAGQPVSTNAAGWQGWIVGPSEWKTFHHSITSAPEAALFRPVTVPGGGVAGGSGTIGLAGGISRHFAYDLKSEPAARGLNLTLSYRSGEGAKTNVSLAFRATVPAGGAVVLKRSGDNARGDGTVLSVGVWPKRR